MLRHKHIILGITGGIAAYKMPLLVREFKRSGADVRVVMTDAAKEFVTPLTLSTLSGNDVITGTFAKDDGNKLHAGTWHITMGQWADVMLIAPATANVIAKLAHGYADDPVTTLALALRKYVVVAPTMDVDMWLHPATQENVSRLRSIGYRVIPPEEGELASGLTGPGRLPELDAILRYIDVLLAGAKCDLHNKNILITAGPTFEAIDPVRFLGNRSSGKMGFALAQAAMLRGANVTLVAGPVHLPTPRKVKRIDVESASEMYREVLKRSAKSDAIIMSAAIADFTPAEASGRKLKKDVIGEKLTLSLVRTADILGHLGTSASQAVLVGFALETEDGLRHARQKLKKKHLDLVVLNNPLTEGAGFGVDTNIVTLISRNGKADRLKKMPKFDVANEILSRVARLL